MKRLGLIFIISAPSGGGKSSLIDKLLDIDPGLRCSISATTRPARSNEIDGVDYYFKTLSEFQSLIDKNQLIEYTAIYDNYYGTPKQQIEDWLNNGFDVLFDINFYGARFIKEQFPHNTISIFLLPPNLTVLEQRLRGRAQDSDEVLKARIAAARAEIELAKHYDYVVTNDDFNLTLQQLHSICIVERIKRSRIVQLNNFGIV